MEYDIVILPSRRHCSGCDDYIDGVFSMKANETLSVDITIEIDKEEPIICDIFKPFVEEAEIFDIYNYKHVAKLQEVIDEMAKEANRGRE